MSNTSSNIPGTETRRETLIKIASAVSMASLATPALSQTDAQHVHNAAASEAKSAGGVYKPKFLNANEYRTLQALCELIVPGASRGNTAEFIDYLCSNNKDLATIYSGGLLWIDGAMQKRSGVKFVDAKAAQQTELLDLIAYRKNAETAPELAPGIRFFNWARRMTVDGYYTSAAGIKEVGFIGNGARGSYSVPQELYDQALKKSGLA